MEHIIALVKFLLSLEPEKRKDFIPVIPFALIDILAGFYMLVIVKREWFLELDALNISLIALLISFTPIIIILMHFAGDTERSALTNICIATVVDALCWMLTAIMYIFLCTANAVYFKLQFGSEFVSKLCTISILYAISFRFMTFALYGVNNKLGTGVRHLSRTIKSGRPPMHDVVTAISGLCRRYVWRQVPDTCPRSYKG